MHVSSTLTVYYEALTTCTTVDSGSQCDQSSVRPRIKLQRALRRTGASQHRGQSPSESYDGSPRLDERISIPRDGVPSSGPALLNEVAKGGAFHSEQRCGGNRECGERCIAVNDAGDEEDAGGGAVAAERG